MAIMITKDELVGLGKWESYLKLANIEMRGCTGDTEILIDEDDARTIGLL